MAKQDKFVSESGLSVILTKLRDWFPFRKKVHVTGDVEIQVGTNNEDSSESVFSVGVPSANGSKKNALEIQRDGDIYIYDRTGKKMNLQNRLNSESGAVNVLMDGYSDIKLDEDEQGNPINGQTYSIKNDDTVQIAIKKLDKRYDFSIREFESSLSFPVFGREGVIYRDLSDGVDYIWDDDEPTGTNPHYVRKSCNIINGGGAADFTEKQ